MRGTEPTRGTRVRRRAAVALVALAARQEQVLPGTITTHIATPFINIHQFNRRRQPRRFSSQRKVTRRIFPAKSIVNLYSPHVGRYKVAQLSQRDRASGWVSYGQKWKTGTGRQLFTDIIGLSSTTVT